MTVLKDIIRLGEAQQPKDDFLALISHEFRTPLTAIQGGARLLVGREADADRCPGGPARAATEPVRVAPLARQLTAVMGAEEPRNPYENAVKYSPDGGEGRTSATSEPQKLAITVTDQGICPAPE